MRYLDAKFNVPVQAKVTQEEWDRIFGARPAGPPPKKTASEHRRGNLSTELHKLPHQRTRESNRKAMNHPSPKEKATPRVVMDVPQERWDDAFRSGDPVV